jgi:hypothetical protein
MAWRPCPFRIDNVYSVVKPFQNLGFEFKYGDMLRFIGDGYSHYDSTTIYNFVSEISGQNFQWRLHDDAPLEGWKELFHETPKRT